MRSLRMGSCQWAEVVEGEPRAHSPAVVLLLVQDLIEGGWFVRGYDRSGRQTIETRHGGLLGARLWAVSEYGNDAIGAWHDVPDDAADPVSYALGVRR
jgi:hypothetical protein